MVSWPELVCGPALAATRHTRPASVSSAFFPPKLKLQFIVSWPEVLCPEVQLTVCLSTVAFRDASSLSGTSKTANGTSVTIGDRGETPVFERITSACGYRIQLVGDVNKVFLTFVTRKEWGVSGGYSCGLSGTFSWSSF